MLEILISEQGLDKRFNEKSADFLEKILKKAIVLFTGEKGVEAWILGKFKDLKVYDSSSVTLPYELKNKWKGAGSRFGAKETAAVKITGCLSLKTGNLKIAIEDGYIQDKSSSLIKEEEIKKGELYIKDLGCYNTSDFEDIDSKGGYFASRLKIQSKVYSRTGKEINLEKEMKNNGLIDKEILLGKTKKLKCRLIALNIPKELHKKRIAKLEKEAVRNQIQLSERKIAFSEFNAFITNIPEEILSFKWDFIDRSLFKAIKVIQDNISILIYSFTQKNKNIIEAISFITSNINECRIDKRKKKPAAFELLAALKDAPYA